MVFIILSRSAELVGLHQAVISSPDALAALPGRRSGLFVWLGRSPGHGWPRNVREGLAQALVLSCLDGGGSRSSDSGGALCCVW
jgi:hypothetical protein